VNCEQLNFEVKKTISITKAKQEALTGSSGLVPFHSMKERGKGLPNFVPTRIIGTPGA